MKKEEIKKSLRKKLREQIWYHLCYAQNIQKGMDLWKYTNMVVDDVIEILKEK